MIELQLDYEKGRAYCYRRAGIRTELAVVDSQTRTEYRLRLVNATGDWISEKRIRVLKSSLKEVGSRAYWQGVYTLEEIGRKMVVIREDEARIARESMELEARQQARIERVNAQVTGALESTTCLDEQLGLYKTMLPRRGKPTVAVYRVRPETRFEARGVAVAITFYTEEYSDGVSLRDERLGETWSLTVAGAITAALVGFGEGY